MAKVLMYILGKSKNQQRLILASPKNNQHEPLQRLLTAIETMPESLRGRIQLGMLGLDNWKNTSMSTQLPGEMANE